MIYILNATNNLTSRESTLRSLTEAAIKAFESLCSFEPIDVVIAENPAMAIPELGIGGYTATAHEVYISLDLSKDKLNDMIDRHLQPTVAHELAHIVRLQKGQNLAVGGTLGDNVVGEGLADYISHVIYPNQVTPWVKSLNDEQFQTMKEKFLSEYNGAWYNHNAWFYGADADTIPRWAGYHLGYALISDYLAAHSELAIQDIIATDTSEIISIWNSKN